MKAKIWSAIIGLTLLLGSPVTLLSLVDSYNSPVAQKAEIETSLQSTLFINVDVPEQDGNIRLLKIQVRDLRNSSNSFRNFLKSNNQLSDFTLTKNVNRILSLRNSYQGSSTAVPLYIKLRMLIV